MRVLVAEDDEVLAKAVAVGLRREGMAVDIALDGDDARTHLAINDYDGLRPVDSSREPVQSDASSPANEQ